jgi:hypothetical protein
LEITPAPKLTAGALLVESEAGTGSVFRVRLPGAHQITDPESLLPE